jgi:hypothetical protein
MKLYVLNGLIGRRGGPQESTEVKIGMTLRVRLEGDIVIEGPVERVWKRTVRVNGRNFKPGDSSICQIIILACASGLPCYDAFTEESLPTGHVWREETFREPNFNVAYGALRICRICGKEQFASFCAGRIGGDWVDVVATKKGATQ